MFWPRDGSSLLRVLVFFPIAVYAIVVVSFGSLPALRTSARSPAPRRPPPGGRSWAGGRGVRSRSGVRPDSRPPPSSPTSGSTPGSRRGPPWGWTPGRGPEGCEWAKCQTPQYQKSKMFNLWSKLKPAPCKKWGGANCNHHSMWWWRSDDADDAGLN